ncbi:MAG TPA: hypothetical protein VMG30_11015 [Acidobacteriota bacterium]|nr:hypothetical protein [Acidobacteriota bacterium]
MNGSLLLLCFTLLAQIPPDTSSKAQAGNRPPDKSAYFAFVDRDYIFTIEIVKPGVPLLNFVSMTDQDARLQARNVRLTLENRKAAAKVFDVETGGLSQSIPVAVLTIHPRSSFGVRVNGDFENVREILGAAVRLGSEELRLAPLSNHDFEILVSKVNQINLGSPDFSEDWRVLKLQKLGERTAIRPQ